MAKKTTPKRIVKSKAEQPSEAAKPVHMSGSAKYQRVAWRAGYKSAAEFNFDNRRGGD